MKRVAIPLAVLVLLALASVALAQSGAGYSLSWWTVDGGGTTSTSANYALTGTIGQADTGVVTGGTYSLTGGFWGGQAQRVSIYLPAVLRNTWP